MTIDSIRDRMNSVWESANREAEDFKDPMLVIERVLGAYRSFGQVEQLSADQVLAEWVLADEESKRFDALALVRELRVSSATSALEQLRINLSSSTDPTSKFEREKVGSILLELGAYEAGSS